MSFIEEIEINDLSEDVTVNFIGVKIGDVNNSSDPSLSISSGDLSSGCNVIILDTEDGVIAHLGVSVYPNPFENIFNIALQQPFQSLTVELFSSSGQRISKQTSIRASSAIVDLTDHLSGLYFVRLTVADQSQWISVVKQ